MNGEPVADSLNDLRNEALEAVASGEALTVVADRLCRAAETLAPDAVCSILTVDATGIIHPLANPSLPGHYANSIDGMAIGPNAGSCGTAAWRGQPVEVVDIAVDPLWADFKALALPLGLRACWSSPIKARDGRVVGTFAFYFRTPRGPSELEKRIVEVCLHICAIAIEHAEAQAHIERLAYFDTLTGLPNRASFHERAARCLAERHAFNVLCLDLDDFRGVNDSLGHMAGDLLLKAVSGRLAGCLGEGDFLARLSGDEFGVIQPDADEADGRHLAEMLLAAFEIPFDIDGCTLAAAASVGIARTSNDDDLQRLASRADLALFAAKREGRNTYRFYTPGMEAGLQAKRRLTEELRTALGNGELDVAYQPIVALASGEVVGFEALMRWNHPTRGPVSPDEFIPLAEETGLIVALGDWVLNEACREAASWPASIRISVNLSAVQLRKPGFAVDVIRALGRSGISPGRLRLEVTETALLGEEVATRETLAALKRVGIGISLDDFGTGYSSLNHLRMMPLDRIKIDMSFVAGLGGDGGSAAIVRAVLALARDLGLRTTAEGIETPAQRDWLRDNGCEDGQGYLFGRPAGRAETRGRIYGSDAGVPKIVTVSR